MTTYYKADSRLHRIKDYLTTWRKASYWYLAEMLNAPEASVRRSVHMLRRKGGMNISYAKHGQVMYSPE